MESVDPTPPVGMTGGEGFLLGSVMTLSVVGVLGFLFCLVWLCGRTIHNIQETSRDLTEFKAWQRKKRRMP